MGSRADRRRRRAERRRETSREDLAEQRRSSAEPWQRVPHWLRTATLLAVPLALIANVLSVVYVLTQLQRITDASRRPTRAAGDHTPGPGVFRGRLRAPADRTSWITSQPVALRVGWLTETTGGKNRSTRTVCVLSELSGAVLETPQGPLAVEPGPDVQVPERTDPDPSSRAPTIDLGARITANAVPSAVTARCRRARSSPAYYEVFVADGSPVTVSMCRHGHRLQPCGVAGDYLSAGGFSRVAQLWAASALFPARVVFALAGLLALVAALLTWRRMPRLAARRTHRERR